MKVYDILLDENYDLRIENGDFVIGESTDQHIRVLLQTEYGQIRHAPTLGANVADLVNEDGAGLARFKRQAQDTLERDGLRVNSLTFDNKLNPKINAEYK